MKKQLSFILATALAGSALLADSGAYVQHNAFVYESAYTQEGYVDIAPHNFVIQSGSHSGTSFNTRSHHANPNNGRTINFWVQNNGSHPVIISINNLWSTQITIQPGQSTHTSLGVAMSTTVMGHVVSAVHGANINIDFSFAQRP